MSLKEWWKGKEKEEAPPTKVGFTGKEMQVNPDSAVTKKRYKARLKRVKKLLKTKFPPGHHRHEKMARTQRRLTMQLKLMKGDY